MHGARPLIKIPAPPVFKPPPVTYASAEIRGKLRVWKTELARQYHIYECAYHARELLRDVDDFAHCGGKGRQRAFDRIRKRLGPAPRLEHADMDKRPVTVWSVLNPRESVALEGDPGRMQDCVTINYLVLGNMKRNKQDLIAEGLWTLEIPDHALGRAIERSGMLPDQIIREAHETLLHLPAKKVLLNGDSFLLRAGKGGFICQFSMGKDVEQPDHIQLHVRAPTWISDDMMGPSQEPLCMKGKPGERLGDAWLRPRPFTKITEIEDGGLKIEVLQ